MKYVHPFSDLKILQSALNADKGCIIDSNILIAATYDPHPFNEGCSELFQELLKLQIPLFTTVTVRSEYLDFVRRITITEKLMDIFSKTKKYNLSEKVKTELKKHKTWIDIEAARGGLPILTDNRIKDTKQNFEPAQHSGKLGWLSFCDQFLNDVLLNHWELLIQELGINYLQLRGSDSLPFLKKPIEWNDMYKLSEKTGVSTNDSMILNAFFTSKFGTIISADFDVAYGVEVQASSDKMCFIPDSLYQRMKKMKF